jgi:hypothetical protein
MKIAITIYKLLLIAFILFGSMLLISIIINFCYYKVDATNTETIILFLWAQTIYTKKVLHLESC